MRMRKTLFLAGACVLLAVGLTLADGGAVHFNVPLDNLGTPEPGTGVAIVTIAEGDAKVEMQGLQALPHESATGQRIRGYAAWLVNSEDALSKLNMGFLFPDGDGVARLRFSATNSKKANLSLGFNLVVITAETELDLARPQPSGPPIAAGHIPGTPDVKTPPPAVEVLMGKVDDNVFGFQPATIVVLNGQTVRWTNVSGKLVPPHTATRAETIDDCAPGQTPPCPASGQDFEFNSGPVPPNGSFTHTFTLPQGKPFALFNYHCTPHRLLGMVGRIFVRVPPQ